MTMRYIRTRHPEGQTICALPRVSSVSVTQDCRSLAIPGPCITVEYDTASMLSLRTPLTAMARDDLHSECIVVGHFGMRFPEIVVVFRQNRPNPRHLRERLMQSFDPETIFAFSRSRVGFMVSATAHLTPDALDGFAAHVAQKGSVSVIVLDARREEKPIRFLTDRVKFRRG